MALPPAIEYALIPIADKIPRVLQEDMTPFVYGLLSDKLRPISVNTPTNHRRPGNGRLNFGLIDRNLDPSEPGLYILEGNGGNIVGMSYGNCIPDLDGRQITIKFREEIDPNTGLVIVKYGYGDHRYSHFSGKARNIFTTENEPSAEFAQEYQPKIMESFFGAVETISIQTGPLDISNHV